MARQKAKDARRLGYVIGAVGGGGLALLCFRLACAAWTSPLQPADPPEEQPSAREIAPPLPTPSCTPLPTNRTIVVLASDIGIERVDLDCPGRASIRATPPLTPGLIDAAWWAIARERIVLRVAGNDGTIAFHTLQLDGSSAHLFDVAAGDPFAGACSWVEASDAIACVHREAHRPPVISTRSLANGTVRTIRWDRSLQGTGAAIVLPDGESVAYAEACDRDHENEACLFRATIRGARPSRIGVLDEDAEVCGLIASRTGEIAALSYDTRIGAACDTLWSIAAPHDARYLGHSWGTSSSVSPTFWSVDFSPDGAEIASLSSENEYCNADGRCLAHLATRRIDQAGHAGASPTRVDAEPFGPPSRLIWIR